ncbi:MAG: nitronate monooxygenase [Alphaproteobacteria bacterium]|nr:nitronate monooxygenase [Alphaproteobacteria bacterium]
MRKTPATVLCGVDLPVFQAGMGGVAGPQLAAAVSEAGGLGHLGGIRLAAADLRDRIRATRELTDRPFGVNLVPPGGGPDGFEAQLDVVVAERPAVLSLFWGEFAGVVARARAAGIVTMIQTGSVVEAERAAGAGADIVIAQGIEAGGHVRGVTGLMDLLPAVIRAVAPIPVLAAGGIADAAAVAAALQMGAAGAWVGTRFVASDESLAHDIYKQRLVDAGPDDTRYEKYYSFGWGIGAPYRIVPPKSRWNPRGLIAGGPRRVDSGAWARGIKAYAGQGVGCIESVLPAGKIVEALSARL